MSISIKCKVFVQGGKKCVRKFDSIREALYWVWEHDNGKCYVIQFRYPEEDEPRYLYC